MPGLDSAKERAAAMPSSGGGFDTYPTLSLKDRDVAYVRFIGDGGGDDKYTDSGYFHREQKVSQRTNNPYTQTIFCARSFDTPDGDVTPCEWCEGKHGQDAAKVVLQIGLWIWCGTILRNKQREQKEILAGKAAFPTKTDKEGRVFFVDEINGPLVYQRGPGKNQSFLDQLKLMRDMAGGLNTMGFTIVRTGSGRDDTNYTHNPIVESKGKEWTEEQKEIIAQLPSIAEIFSGRETWPRTMSAGGAANEMITPESLQTLQPSAPAAKETKKSKEAAPAEALLPTSAPPGVTGEDLF
jgi:hypothetical protein